MRPSRARRANAAGGGYPEPEKGGRHIPVQGLVRLRCGLQVHAGVRKKQRDSILTAYSAARLLRRKYRCRPCSGCRREPHTGFPRTETAQPESERRLEGYHRHLRIERQGTFHE